MTAPTPYLHFPGTASRALSFYHGVFGGELTLNTNADFGATEGDPGAIAHGILDGPVSLFAADTDATQEAFASSGLMFALLGTADAATLHQWFTALAEGGTVVDDLRERPWGASDGQVRDQFGLLWLVGYEPEPSAD
jgi:PhnB protein